MKLTNLPVNERSVSHFVTDTIRKAIIRGELRLGERLVEANLAKSLNVSITPVRHAFSQLSQEGLIHVYPYKGTYVVDITERFIDEVCSARMILEIKAVELSYSKLDQEDFNRLKEYASEMERLLQMGLFEESAKMDILFHRVFYEKSGHSVLIELWNSIQSRIQLFQSYGRWNRNNPKGYIEQRHLKIIELVRKRDLPLLLENIKEHIDSSRIMMIQSLKHTNNIDEQKS